MTETKRKAKRPRRTPTGAYSGKTKLDKWLETEAEIGTVLSVVIQPPAPYPYKSDKPDDCKFRVRVEEVDRYSVRMEFSDHVSEHDGASWWVKKDSICAIGYYVEEHDEHGDEDDWDDDDL